MAQTSAAPAAPSPAIAAATATVSPIVRSRVLARVRRMIARAINARLLGTRFSIGTKLVAYTIAILAIGSAALYVHLTRRERQNALDAKQTTATMVSDLFVTFVSPRLEFADADGVASDIQHLRANPEVLSVVVYDEHGERVGLWSRDGNRKTVPARPTAGQLGTIRIESDNVTVTRAIVDKVGEPIGSAVLTFSLERENAMSRDSRVRILTMTLVLGVGIGVMLLLMARRQIIQPLRALASAAGKLERGETTSPEQLFEEEPQHQQQQQHRGSTDEISQLSAAFRHMGIAVIERARRMKQELAVATHIQTAILPRDFQTKGASIVAAMKPAAEVGGDYYDVLPTDDGCWFGIGDVSGHGLNAGLIMLMIQSSVETLVKENPAVLPSKVISVVNRVLYENVRKRLLSNDHATLTILHMNEAGDVTFAGAHEEIVIYRALSKTVDLVETPGTWVGAIRDVSSVTEDSTLHLETNDVMVLYTDGVTEARNAAGEYFGIERLTTMVEALGHEPAEVIRQRIWDEVVSFTNRQDDDISLVVVKKTSPHAEETTRNGR